MKATAQRLEQACQIGCGTAAKLYQKRLLVGIFAPGVEDFDQRGVAQGVTFLCCFENAPSAFGGSFLPLDGLQRVLVLAQRLFCVGQCGQHRFFVSQRSGLLARLGRMDFGFNPATVENPPGNQ